MNIIVGDKQKFALECIVSNEKEMLGRIFLYVNNIRFGQDSFDEELVPYFFGAVRETFFYNEVPGLIKLSVSEFIELLNCIYDDFDGESCSS